MTQQIVWKLDGMMKYEMSSAPAVGKIKSFQILLLKSLHHAYYINYKNRNRYGGWVKLTETCSLVTTDMLCYIKPF